MARYLSWLIAEYERQCVMVDKLERQLTDAEETLLAKAAELKAVLSNRGVVLHDRRVYCVEPDEKAGETVIVRYPIVDAVMVRLDEPEPEPMAEGDSLDRLDAELVGSAAVALPAEAVTLDVTDLGDVP